MPALEVAEAPAGGARADRDDVVALAAAQTCVASCFANTQDANT